jgi:hypothetical protein
MKLQCKRSIKYSGTIECLETNTEKYPIFNINLCGYGLPLRTDEYLLCDIEFCLIKISTIKDIPIVVLGDTFFSRYYTYFN